jgi:hypothetical protein
MHIVALQKILTCFSSKYILELESTHNLDINVH